MLAKDVPTLYARRARAEALDSLQLSERECLADGELDMGVAMETRNRLYQLRKSTNQAVNELSVAPLDTPADEPVTNPSQPTLSARRAVGVCAPRPAVHGGDLHGGDLIAFSNLPPLSHSDGGGG